MNKLTGELTLKRAFDADLSNVEYPLVVLARDAGYPSLVTVVELPVTVVTRPCLFLTSHFMAYQLERILL